MPYYRNKQFFEVCNHVDLDTPYEPSERVVRIGIYRCECGFETAIAKALDPLPNERRCRDHAPEWHSDRQADVVWHLVAGANRQNTGTR
jgi:hypothetical protein